MTSPSHIRNRFGFQSSTASPSHSPATAKLAARYTPSPTKFDSPRPSLNLGRLENGNYSSPKTSVTSPTLAVNPRAVYLTMKPDFSEDLYASYELKQALQIGGFNPTDEQCEKLWGTRSKMSFDEFERIIESLGPPPTELELLELFRKFDKTGKGFIRKDVLIDALTTRGDKMSEDRVEKILNHDGTLTFFTGEYFDYRAFCYHMTKTSHNLMTLAKEVANTDGQNFAINSKTYRIRKKSSSPLKTTSSWDNHVTTLKGGFYFEGDSLISHQYTMKVNHQGKYQISIHSAFGYNIDCQLFIFKVNEHAMNKNADSRYTFIERTPLAFPKKKRKDDEAILQNSSSWSGTLDKGLYLLVPSTTGCKLQRRSAQPASSVELVTTEENDGNRTVQLSDKFRAVLTDIFYQIDLDSNGTLSRDEFNLFNWRTSGEEVQDEEWKVVQENFPLDDGELSLEGFLRLHQMEAEDSGGDSAELWVTLNSMGYNYSLVQDEVAMFEVSAYSEPGIEPVTLAVSGLKSGGPLLDKATIRCIMDGSKQSKLIDSSKEILLYREDTPNMTSFVLQNRSASTVTMMMDFSQSKNVLINHPHLKFSTTLTPRSTLFVAQLIPEHPEKDFQPHVDISLVR